MTRAPIQIYLPVCPTCSFAGKLPSTPQRRDHCTGGTKNPHRSTKMEARLFEEVIEDQELRVA